MVTHTLAQPGSRFTKIYIRKITNYQPKKSEDHEEPRVMTQLLENNAISENRRSDQMKTRHPSPSINRSMQNAIGLECCGGP
ncbi:unnamed protein product [Caenorhabditis angaria]|uniref:Uncharacterized protein n=1 Tax=Caenorhabditis angaria TaxID=860376 RepID=A0A9P1IWG4_9PELO|nr:unnamed protein product [Caenorhabditis angaria]